MSWRTASAILLLLGAFLVGALAVAALIYSSLLSHGQGMPEGGGGLLLICSLLFVGMAGGAVWLLWSERAEGG